MPAQNNSLLFNNQTVAPIPQLYQQQPTTAVNNDPQQMNDNAQRQSNIIWVNNEQQVDMYPLSLNSAISFISANGDILYIKARDQFGFITKKKYKITEMLDSPIADQQEEQHYPDERDYATKDEIEMLRQEIKSLRSQIGGYSKNNRRG